LVAFTPRVVSSSLALTWVATGQCAAYITDDVRASVHFSTSLGDLPGRRCTITDLCGMPAERHRTA
jgi:myo-inositol-1(or 4)-monophosphatase